MVDKLDDEYVFSDSDLDEMNPELLDLENDPTEAPVTQPNYAVPGENPVLRNVLIVIAIILFFLVAYKFIHSFLFKKTSDAEITPVTQPVVVAQPAPVEVKTVTPVLPQPVNTSNESINKINVKLSDLEATQQSLSANLSNNASQLNAINSSTTELTNKIITLNNAITALSNKLEDQSAEITRLLAKEKKNAQKSKPVVPKKITPARTYYIQAVIPGRAWIIASNGTTLTVREGSTVPGYGVVKLIDAEQGRLIMSSGKTIKFSQIDS